LQRRAKEQRFIAVTFTYALYLRAYASLSRSGLFDRFAARYLYGMLRLTSLGLMPIYKQYGIY